MAYDFRDKSRFPASPDAAATNSGTRATEIPASQTVADATNSDTAESQIPAPEVFIFCDLA